MLMKMVIATAIAVPGSVALTWIFGLSAGVAGLLGISIGGVVALLVCIAID